MTRGLPGGDGFHVIRWVTDEDEHFVAQRVSWGRGEPEEWQIAGDNDYFHRGEIQDLIGEAEIEIWKWEE